MSETKTTTMTAATDAPYFSTDIIFNILVFVPANVLHEVARYVCKQWYDIVSDPLFVTTHRELSTPGFLVQDEVDLHRVYNLVIVDSATPKLNETVIPIPAFGIFTPFPKILGCFNGLVLLTDLLDREIILYVTNPAAILRTRLPPLTGLSSDVESTAGLAVDSSGHYKAVHVFVKRTLFVTELQIRVFTIGIDKAWRFLDLEGIPVNQTSIESMLLRPFCLAGFIYWFTYNKANSFGLAINVDTETLYQFSHPPAMHKSNTLVSVVSIGTSLGFIQVCGYKWRLWKLTDVKSGKWTKLANMDMIPLYDQLKNKFGCLSDSSLRPVRLFGGYWWLYLRFKKKYDIVRYNLGNESIVSFPTQMKFKHRGLQPYASTLVSPRIG